MSESEIKTDSEIKTKTEKEKEKEKEITMDSEIKSKSKSSDLPKIKYLAFSGGGAKGITYIGVHQALWELDILKTIEKISSTSIGAAFALLIALKWEPKQVYDLAINFEPNRLKEMNFLTILNTWGLETGNKWVEFVKTVIKKTLGNGEATFTDLWKFNPIEITFTATHINTRDTIYYNYKNSPDEPIFRAFRKTISYPLAFCPVKIDDEVFADGCIRDNFPIQLFPNSKSTCGFNLEDCCHEWTKIEHPESYLSNLIKSATSAVTAYKIKQYQKSHIINFECDVDSSDFLISMERKLKMYQIGYDTTLDYFKKLGYNCPKI